MSQTCPYCQYELEPFATTCPGCEQNKARQAGRTGAARATARATAPAPIASVTPQQGHPGVGHPAVRQPAVRPPAPTSATPSKGIPSGAKWLIAGVVLMIAARLIFTVGMWAIGPEWNSALGPETPARAP